MSDEATEIIRCVAQRRAEQYRIDGWNAIADAIDRFAEEAARELNRRAPVQPEQPDAAKSGGVGMCPSGCGKVLVEMRCYPKPWLCSRACRAAGKPVRPRGAR